MTRRRRQPLPTAAERRERFLQVSSVRRKQRIQFAAKALELVAAKADGRLPDSLLAVWGRSLRTIWGDLPARERTIRRAWFVSLAEVGSATEAAEAEDALRFLDAEAGDIRG